MKTNVNGATVYLPEDEIEDECQEQIAEVAEHEAFSAEDIRVMPDTHWGSGAPIGFTMPIQDSVVPNIVGVDIGCGMAWARLEGVTPEDWEDESWADDVDKAVRDAVPMGFNVRDEPAMHIVDEFPWDVCDEKLDKLLAHLDYDMTDTPDWFEGYGGEYFKTLCKRVGYDINRAIMSLGSLGGGNHFIEFAHSVETDSVYVTLHSGSRGIGAEIAQHWQEKAHTATFKRNAEVEIPKSEWKYLDAPGHGIKWDEDDNEYVLVKAGDIEINREAILEDYDGEAIEGKFGQLKQYMNAGKNDKDDLDWLEGTEAIGYYIDMIFAQTYAAESRRIMREEAAKAVGAELDYNSSGQSVHNYIDFDTGIIRKGATAAQRGEIAFIPYNMKDGSLLVRGKGNEEWNYSAPHGAGRVMSRTEAKNVLSADDVEKEMEGIHTTNIPLDEAPDSYKDMELIETALQPTADIVDRLKPLHNLKA